MIGYMYQQQAYKLLDLQCQTVFSSCHVQFNKSGTISKEDVTPWKSTPSPDQWEGLLPNHPHLPEQHDHESEDGDVPDVPGLVGAVGEDYGEDNNPPPPRPDTLEGTPPPAPHTPEGHAPPPPISPPPPPSRPRPPPRPPPPDLP